MENFILRFLTLVFSAVSVCSCAPNKPVEEIKTCMASDYLENYDDYKENFDLVGLPSNFHMELDSRSADRVFWSDTTVERGKGLGPYLHSKLVRCKEGYFYESYLFFGDGVYATIDPENPNAELNTGREVLTVQYYHRNDSLWAELMSCEDPRYGCTHFLSVEEVDSVLTAWGLLQPHAD